jgi:hypothetical protein
MINQKARKHPYYPVTEEIKKKYPAEVSRWEKLNTNAEKPECRGCLTCEHYSPVDREFVDVEVISGNPIPWDTEAAWVYCSVYLDHDRPLQINCRDWKPYKN